MEAHVNFDMTSQTQLPHSRAVKAIWISLGSAFGCGFVFFVGQFVNLFFPFAQSPRGLLTGYVPRIGLFLLWVGEALAVVVGLASLLLIRRSDMSSKAIIGIVVGSVCGITVGLIGVIFFGSSWGMSPLDFRLS